MLETTNHWLSSAVVSEIENEIDFSNYHNNYSQVSQHIEPAWASLSLVISK